LGDQENEKERPKGKTARIKKKERGERGERRAKKCGEGA